MPATEVKHREQFVLLDEQQVAFQLVEQAVERADDENTKTVVIVLGGPGSGKSVVALSLSGAVAGRAPRAPRDRLELLHRDHAQDRRRCPATAASRCSSTSTASSASAKNSLDILICDEAHRIRETVSTASPSRRRAVANGRSRSYRRRPHYRSSCSTNTRWCAQARWAPSAEIRTAAEAAGCRVGRRLEGQYRCGGSQLYDQWVLRLLGLDLAPPVPWSTLTSDSDETYRVAALPSPDALESWLASQNPEAGTPRASRRATAGRGATRR